MPNNTRSVGAGARIGSNGNGIRAGVSFGWPTERWAALLVLAALGLLILIRFGFRGIGVSGSASARIGV